MSLKKVTAGVLTLFVSSAVIGCASDTVPNGRYIQTPYISAQNAATRTVLKPQNISEIVKGSISLNNLDSGVVITTVSGGALDQEGNVQRLTVAVSGIKNGPSGNRKNLDLAANLNIPDQRHGVSEAEFINQVKTLKNAAKKGPLWNKRRIFINRPLKEGDSRTFKLTDTETGKIDHRTVTLKKATRTALFWVDNSELATLDEKVLNDAAAYWENKAYPVVTNSFGAAPLPPNDVDGEKRIHLYIGKISDNKGLFGYFSPMDVISDRPESNSSDILYINSWMFKKGESSDHYAKSTLIHEFQHLVNFNNKVVQRAIKKQEPVFEDRWLNEGMATYAEQLGGLGLPAGDLFAASYLQSFFNEPSKYPVVTNDAGLNYGAAYLFALYLAEQHGPATMKRLTESDKGGIENVELITGKPFARTFSDWATALLLSGSGNNPRYDFKSVDLHKAYGKINLDGINITAPVNQFPAQLNMDLNNWSVNYLKLDGLGGKPMNLNIKNQGNALVTSNLVALK